MTLQELNKLYDDLCHRIVEIKFIQQEIYNLATTLFEEISTIKYKDSKKEMDKMAEYYGQNGKK